MLLLLLLLLLSMMMWRTVTIGVSLLHKCLMLLLLLRNRRLEVRAGHAPSLGRTRCQLDEARGLALVLGGVRLLLLPILIVGGAWARVGSSPGSGSGPVWVGEEVHEAVDAEGVGGQADVVKFLACIKEKGINGGKNIFQANVLFGRMLCSG